MVTTAAAEGKVVKWVFRVFSKVAVFGCCVTKNLYTADTVVCVCGVSKKLSSCQSWSGSEVLLLKAEVQASELGSSKQAVTVSKVAEMSVHVLAEQDVLESLPRDIGRLSASLRRQICELHSHLFVRSEK